MRSFFILLPMFLSSLSAYSQDIPDSNSEYFSIENYVFPDAGSSWNIYRLQGYIQKGPVQAQPKIFLLPQLQYSEADIIFIDPNGVRFNPEDEDIAKPAETIQLRLMLNRSLPNATQLPAIGAAVKGVKIQSYQPRPWLNSQVTQLAQYDPSFRASINQAIANVMSRQETQNQYIQDAEKYKMVLSSIDKFKITASLDGEQLAEMSFPGSFVSNNEVLPPITIRKPSVYQKNRILDTGLDITVRYEFIDSNVKSIDASLDTEQIIKNFLDISQEAITSSKASGWAVFGIGSRKSSITQSFSQQVTASFDGDKIERSRIVMDDADQALIDRFEKAFFKDANIADVISNHENAAAKAQASGNDKLAAIHLKYADSLKNGVELDEVDSVKAAAALAAQDYASFIAEGVRFNSEKNDLKNTFRKVVNTTINLSEKKEWLEAVKSSVRRDISSSIQMTPSIEPRAYLGLCGSGVYGYVEVRNVAGFLSQNNETGMGVTCVIEGSPLEKSAIGPGSVIVSIGSDEIDDLTDLENALKKREPGQTVDLYLFDPIFGSQLTGEIRVPVTLGSAPPF